MVYLDLFNFEKKKWYDLISIIYIILKYLYLYVLLILYFWNYILK